MRAPDPLEIPMRLPAILLMCASLAGCGLVYRIDVQQGNYLTQDAAARLKVGMSRAEARQTLGTPLLADAFHANRWDYYFSNVKGGKAEDSKRFSVFFQDDKVVSFSGGTQPPAPPPVNSTTPPAATIR
jgi:outer membrane protein assembly factor BamE